MEDLNCNGFNELLFYSGNNHATRKRIFKSDPCQELRLQRMVSTGNEFSIDLKLSQNGAPYPQIWNFYVKRGLFISYFKTINYLAISV